MTQEDDAEKLELREQAKQTVDRFVRRFDESYRLLAYHAALPLVLTPELVNYLRNEFLRNEQVPWVAEIDLLLSELCSQVGYELYAMDTHVRAYLLEEMKNDERFSKRRMQEVAQVLYSYVNYLSRLNPGKRQKELEAQRLAAMVYLSDEPCKAAAREIAQKLLEVSTGIGSVNLDAAGIKAELASLTRITKELSPQLQQEPSLLEYASLVQQLLKNPGEVSSEQINRLHQVEDVELRISDSLLLGDLASNVSSSQQKVIQLEGFPPIQTFGFQIPSISFQKITEILPDINLQPFAFESATIELKKSEISERDTEVIIHRYPQQSQYFIEDLGNEIELEMVLISGGTFTMGAPEDEKGSRDSERPQHQVTVPTFLMGRYEITQAQWRAVANLPQVEKELKLELSSFKGDDLPVESVSWYDAVEFCARLSNHTGREYRLPSEAEWEYACRAGTTTPFHFGETITVELANYAANNTFANEPKGEHREQTTPVGQFPPNSFGLHDMHGNVWEWCIDDWHDSYKGAPTNGSAWVESESENDNRSRKVLRGGSWYDNPVGCRSAFRGFYSPGIDYYYIGLRVVCVVAPRTLQ